MNLLQRIRGGGQEARSIGSVDDYLNALQIAQLSGGGLPGVSVQQTLGGQSAERIGNDFASMAAQVYGRNSVIFACMLARQSVFSQVRFQWQALNKGRPSELFSTPALQQFEKPWQGGTTGDLLARTINDADLAGNAYWWTRESEFIRLRPDWLDIVLESRVVGRDPDTGDAWVVGSRKLGYLYSEGGRGVGTAVPLMLSEVAHYAPIPDPLASFRGMSWLTPLIREVQADELMTRHKHKFFENGASVNLVVKHDATVTPEKARLFKEMLDEQYTGVDNAYRIMHLGGGADITPVGANLEQIEFQVNQSHGETRIAAAAGVPPVIVGLSKGLESSTYSNYSQARRRFADGTLHPLWSNLAGSMQQIAPPPPGSRLWYDTRDVPFLREDSKDAAEIAQMQATTMATLVREGYDPESVQRAVMSGDFGLLKHTGLVSVQLRPPGEDAPAESQQSDPAADAATPTETKSTGPGPESNGRVRSWEAAHA